MSSVQTNKRNKDYLIHFELNTYTQALAIRPVCTKSKLNLISTRSINRSLWMPNFIGCLCKTVKSQVFEGKHLLKIIICHKCGFPKLGHNDSQVTNVHNFSYCFLFSYPLFVILQSTACKAAFSNGSPTNSPSNITNE